MHTEVTFPVAAPAERVWAILSDVERWPTWTASMSQVVIDGPLEVGAVAKIRQPKLPPTAWTVTEVVPGRSFSWESKAPGSRAVGEHEITPTGDDTCEVRLMLDQTGPVRQPGGPPLPGPDQALRPDGGRRARRRGDQALKERSARWVDR